MDNDKLKYGIGGLIIGGMAIWLLTISSVNSNNIGIMGMMGLRTSSMIQGSEQ